MLDILVIIAAVLFFLTSIVLGSLLWRASRRLIEFDDLFALMVHEMETNAKFLDGFADRPVLSNSPEIIDATRGMRIMRDRLKEYVTRVGEVRNVDEEQDTDG